MHESSFLFDRAALLRRRQRAVRSGVADFLHDWAAIEVNERLMAVNRALHDAAVIGPLPAVWVRALEGPGRNWRLVEDADTLDLAPASLDLAVHGLALHWANDPVGQLIQCRRALRPDGLFLAALFGGETLRELRTALAEAEASETGGLSPRVAPMAEIRDLGGLMQRAGFALPVADSQRLTVSYPSALALMHDLRAMGETNVLGERLRRPTRRGVLAAAAAAYAARHGDADGRIPATFDVIFLTGWAPADSQPRPLRPGSAASRLADALGTVERRPGPEA